MLTPKQERFAQCVASGMTQADAYREAYDCKPTTKPETIQKRASELMSSGEVAGRVSELRIPIVAKVGITLETHLADLLELRNKAAEASQFSAAITAEVARGKAAGVNVEKSEVTQTVRNLPPITDEDWL